MASEKAHAPVAELRLRVAIIKKAVSGSKNKQIRSALVKRESKDLAIYYFNNVRPFLFESGLDDESLAGLDNWVQELLTLTQKAAQRTVYSRTLKAIEQELNGLEVALLTTSSSARHPRGKLDGKELRIASTLASLVASAGLSYEQACLDLRNDTRRSYRGAAAELREALREALDHLAPDKDVMELPNFRLDAGKSGPTMQQKVRFILKSRGKNKAQTEAPESAVSVVEERVGALARSVYTRSSLSTHVGTTKQEVQQVKAYVDVVLSELLEIA